MFPHNSSSEEMRKIGYHVRISEEIPYRKLQRQMQELIKEGRIEQLGQKRWTQYQLVP